jgi:hypothetical protein
LISELAIVQKIHHEEVEQEVNNILEKYHETYQSINSAAEEELEEDIDLEKKLINY